MAMIVLILMHSTTLASSSTGHSLTPSNRFISKCWTTPWQVLTPAQSSASCFTHNLMIICQKFQPTSLIRNITLRRSYILTQRTKNWICKIFTQPRKLSNTSAISRTMTNSNSQNCSSQPFVLSVITSNRRKNKNSKYLKYLMMSTCLTCATLRIISVQQAHLFLNGLTKNATTGTIFTKKCTEVKRTSTIGLLSNCSIRFSPQGSYSHSWLSGANIHGSQLCLPWFTSAKLSFRPLRIWALSLIVSMELRQLRSLNQWSSVSTSRPSFKQSSTSQSSRSICLQLSPRFNECPSYFILAPSVF